ncbi:hypothetical protein L914_12487 [Phytophthora nicotianae]|uniref:Uncharacterized protein n=1 Tax=Phytophthora nicotianae TaxID=4792 RepID=W2MZR5_PHYNI|nr:hypothetical protein L914_12487 [Phytophthora nicotianae]
MCDDVVAFAESEDTSSLLQDVLAFLDNCEDASDVGLLPGGSSSFDSTQSFSSGPVKKRYGKEHSAEYDRHRREKKKAEREALRNQVVQYEAQLELLRLQKPGNTQENKKWGWIHAATMEEEKRHKAEELNRQLKGLLFQQLNTAQILRNFIAGQSTLTEHVQSVMGGRAPCPVPMPTGSFAGLGDIAMYLKGVFKHIQASSDYVFASSPLFSEANSSDALMSMCSIKHRDPIAGSCIELLSSTPLDCGYDVAVPMLWEMLLTRQIFGPEAVHYEQKSKHLTANSAEIGYTFSFGAPDEPTALNGVTLMGKFEKEGSALLVWTSMLVQRNGLPSMRSQGWISITRPLKRLHKGTVVRMFCRLSGRHFGVPGGYTDVNITVAKKHQLLVKSRIERVQQRMVDLAELQK